MTSKVAIKKKKQARDASSAGRSAGGDRHGQSFESGISLGSNNSNRPSEETP